MLGTIKFYNENKKFGFIVNDQNKDVFFHISNVNPACKDDMGHKAKDKQCEFEMTEGRNGPEACDVTLL